MRQSSRAVGKKGRAMRIGTVGSGTVVENFIEAARTVPGVDITAVYSRTPERAEAFALEQGVAQTFTSREEFLAGDFDFAYIANPNSLHYEWVKEALHAGKNVIGEKPMASNLAEAQELAELAKEKGLFLFEAMSTPHLPNVALVKELLPEIGKIRFAQASFCQFSSRYLQFLGRGTDPAPNVFNRDFSGGAMMDLACYNIAFLTEVFGAPGGLAYYANLADNGIDTSGVLVLAYDGFHATSLAAKDSASKNFSQIQGERGYMYIGGQSSRFHGGVTLVRNGSDTEEYFNPQGDSDPHFYKIAEFKRIYDERDFDGRDKFLEKTLTVMRILDAARECAGIVFPADVHRESTG